MKRSANLESAKRLIRQEICSVCHRRHPADAKVDPGQPLQCEHGCGIFVHLPQLVQLATMRDPMLEKRPTKSVEDKDATALDEFGDKAVSAISHAGIYTG